MGKISKSVKKQDSPAKSGGSELYIADYRFDGMLHAVTVRSDIPRGKIVSVTYPEMPEGYWIVDAGDIPGKNSVKMLVDDWPFFAVEEVNYIGEPIALIVGPDKALVRQLAEKTKIEYEPEEAVFSVEDASKGEKKAIYGDNNLFAEYLIEKGDAEKEFQRAHLILEETYRTGYQEHTYLEPQGMIGKPEDDGSLTVFGSMQCPYYVKNALLQALDLPENKVRVVETTTGGGFGGKEEYPSMLAGHVAFAALKTGSPVALILEREEDISVTTKRHPSEIRLKAAVDVGGRISALEADIVLDGGAYAGLSAVVLQRAMFAAAGVYDIPNTKIMGRAYATNHVPSGAYRGFGAPQAIFAMEMHMVHLARLLGEDPVAYKKKHFVKQGSSTVTSGKFHHRVPLPEIADRVDELFVQNPVNHKEDGRLRGIGYSFFLHGCGFTGSGERDIIKARLKLRRDRNKKVTILAASVDMGQGAQTTLRKIVSETLDIPMNDVIYNNPDTSLVPDSGPTVASRTAMIVGGLVEKAAEKMKSRWNEEGDIEVEVNYRQPEGIEWDQQKLKGDAYPDYSWGGIAMEVAVDPVTFETEVLGIWSVFDVGEVLDENILIGQVHGGIAQGIGWASIEVMRSEKGKLKQKNMTDYVIPAANDLPDMVNDFINVPYPEGPFGAKGAGELTFVGAAPAYLAAVEDALKKSLNEIPASPEYLYKEVNNGK